MSEKVSGIPVKRNPSTPNSPKKKEGPVRSLISEKEHVLEKSQYPQMDKSGEISQSSVSDGSKKSDDVLKTTFTTKENDHPRNENLLYFTMLAVVTVLAFFTRFYNIEIPAWICWDETHFGKMGSWYINHSFFFDVHPPLGKMLIGMSGYLSGYDGEFPFNKPGDEYGDVQYVGMRMFCATLGAALVPLVFMSTWLLCRSTTAALFAAAFVLFDTGVNTLSRYILLDPILMFFIMASTYALLKFLSLRDRPFTFIWWLWLSMTGIFLSCSIGVKFVGLFVILLAGYSTVDDLWRLLGNQNLSMVFIVKHFLARALCLIGLPVICYMLIFAVHFKVLYKTGGGDGFYSSQFQSQLEGNRLHNVSMPDRLAYGSVFSLKQQRTGGAYLHSHWHLYPEEHPPRQQQVTTYSHKDENNMWRVKPAIEEADVKGPPVIVRNGDLVRLEHVGTRRNLHTHREPAPLTPRHFQLTGYGQDGVGDANDVWQIQVPGAEEGSELMAVRSKLRLVHYYVRCALHSHDKKLPKWGWEQLEATCNPNTKDPKTLWSVEEVIDPRLPNVSFEVYHPSFLDKFLESHAVMTQGNSGLKPKEGEVTSRPWQWPINIRGQIFSGMHHKVILLGNPVLWFGVHALMVLFLILYAVHAFRLQRGAKMSQMYLEFSECMFGACWWLMAAWALHYLPFWPMTRVLYFHHYFPAFLYSCMLAGVVVDYMIKLVCLVAPPSLSVTLFHIAVGLVLSATSYSFYLFHPLTFGMGPGSSQEEGHIMHGLRWLDSWEF
ncbi:protein O-mannosyl-transferase 2-like [Mya arenaria]|uniref:protein O-mannosyl-transferase 2-like n=1 Tax=Mya arenaria TaxID=6604 RepID=UPI0022DF62C2|nr:protein O-mannosyl-transferase 2-like [Mya arenaria]